MEAQNLDQEKKNKFQEEFAVFILTHGRPDRVVTFKTLREGGYTGRIVIVIDNEDKTADQYFKTFGKENVFVFDKKAVAETFDEFDNFEDRRAIIYARNASFQIAEELGIKYFIQFDDDYVKFDFRINGEMNYPKGFFKVRSSFDQLFFHLLEYYKKTPFVSIAMSQGGDWFGGGTNFNAPPKRKAMNSFICSIERKFQFIGRINEDVNTYTAVQGAGSPFLTIPFVSLTQKQTQSNKGGMTDIYLDSGTYIKSFYTIICSPNCTQINLMGSANRRLHHSISWENACPVIIDEKWKKR